MKDSIKYIGGMGEDLTGSSTLLKLSGKDSLSVVIDYGLHQGGKGDNELNNMTDSEVLNSDFVIITHAHMDHIGRLPMLISQGFKGRIIMTSMTKELASLMLINNVTLTTDQIKQVGDLNNKKAYKLKKYLKILSISKRLKENHLTKGDKWKLEKERTKLLEGGNIEKLLKESISFLQGIDENIDISRILTRKQAVTLLDTEERIIEILEIREKRIDKNKLEFDNSLNVVVDLKRKINAGDNSNETLKQFDKYLFLLSLYPVEIKNKLDENVGVSKTYSQEKKSLLLIQQEILKEVLNSFKSSYPKSKSTNYKKEKEELSSLIEKRNHIIGDKDLELCIEYSKKILGKQDDFKEIKNDIPTLLYDTQMVYNTLELVETLEPGEEMDLECRMVINKLDSEVISRIPQIIKDGYSKKIYVNHKIITGIVARWNKEYTDVVENNRKNKELRIEYETANKFINRYNRAKNKSKIDVKEGFTVDEYYEKQVEILQKSEIYILKSELTESLNIYKIYLSKIYKYELVKDKSIEYFDELLSSINSDDEGNIEKINKDRKLFLEYLDFIKSEDFFRGEKEKLDKYNIKEDADIDKVVGKIYGSIKLPYTKKEIEHAKSRLVPTFENNNQRTIEKVALKFFNAGHVEGSVMASISLITKKVENILNYIPHKVNNRGFESLNKPIKEHINLLFTGDMGKFKDSNISGTPDIPDLKYDYVQFESTYSTRNHPDKEKEFSKFIYELNTGYGNKLIAAFSFQRTQEILVELMQNKFDNIELLKKYSIFKSKLKRLNREFKHILNSDLSDLNETEKKLKIEKFLEKTELEKKLLEIEKTVFLGTVVVDAPLAMQIGEVFLRKYPEKYKFLDPEYQKSVFGKPMIKVLRQGEYKNLYKGNATKSGYIILSSGGMMQGGAIINHAKEIVSDKNAKIIFTGFQARNTLGGKILNKESSVIIDGDSYDVNAKIVPIGGYSSHIEKDDIIDFVTNKLKLSKNSILASTHGTSDRRELVKSILDVNNKLNIIIPEVGNTQKFDFLKN